MASVRPGHLRQDRTRGDLLILAPTSNKTPETCKFASTGSRWPGRECCCARVDMKKERILVVDDEQNARQALRTPALQRGAHPARDLRVGAKVGEELSLSRGMPATALCASPVVELSPQVAKSLASRGIEVVVLTLGGLALGAQRGSACPQLHLDPAMSRFPSDGRGVHRDPKLQRPAAVGFKPRGFASDEGGKSVRRGDVTVGNAKGWVHAAGQSKHSAIGTLSASGGWRSRTHAISATHLSAASWPLRQERRAECPEVGNRLIEDAPGCVRSVHGQV
jgi:hypothetical protein